jgi:hypothetical protein
MRNGEAAIHFHITLSYRPATVRFLPPLAEVQTFGPARVASRVNQLARCANRSQAASTCACIAGIPIKRVISDTRVIETCRPLSVGSIFQICVNRQSRKSVAINKGFFEHHFVSQPDCWTATAVQWLPRVKANPQKDGRKLSTNCLKHCETVRPLTTAKTTQINDRVSEAGNADCQSPRLETPYRRPLKVEPEPRPWTPHALY